MQQAVLSLAYLGPVEYFSVIAGNNSVLIEQWDSYHKQTYRNRCRILSANGVLDMVIPVVKESGKKILVKDVKIDYSTRWQENHWRSLFSAYNSSPFFEYYSDDFRDFYEKKWNFLLDFNIQITELICDLSGIRKNFQLTTEYVKEYSNNDYRLSITPKRPFSDGMRADSFKSYHQNFREKFGFIPNLSIVDLLFNEGEMVESLL